MSRFNLLLFLLICSTTLVFSSYSFAQLQELAVTIDNIGAESIVFDVPELRSQNNEVHPIPKPILFTGDILLARHVEYLMNQNGATYPFRQLTTLFASSSYVIANFEAAIPLVHQKTPNGKMVFSVPSSSAAVLYDAGVTHVSLANNHAIDQGTTGYLNTRAILTDANITPFGHPVTLSSSSITFINYGEVKISIIGIHTLFKTPDITTLTSLLGYMASNSDIQIAYMHWGNEYQPKHSLKERVLAETVIEKGIDAIIGHHPHVTQDIEVINNVPIFYSLGNLIFDQYFSLEVQQGYMLQLSVNEKNFQFDLLPVTSVGTKAQPRVMNQQEKDVFLTDLATRSQPELAENIKRGRVIIDRTLATSTKNSIISL